MAKQFFAPSRERGKQLMAAGCPLDYPEVLPGPSFRAEPLGGYTQSRVYSYGWLQTDYVISLRLGTDRPSGIVISRWRLVPAWKDPMIDWSYEAEDIVPKQDYGVYDRFFDSRLSAVLNDHRLLRRGYPVEGLLCGRSCQSMPELGENNAIAQLKLIDDRGAAVSVSIALEVISKRVHIKTRFNASQRRALITR